MTPSHLVACPSCARHVRVTERACPFCSSVLSATLRSSPAPRAPAARLSRAALYAFGAGTLSMASACGGTTSPGVESHQMADAYGGPPVDTGTHEPMDAADGGPALDSGTDATRPCDFKDCMDSGLDAPPPMIDAAYGGPGFDTGADTMFNGAYGSPARDSGGNEPDVMGGALYGAPP